jgi:pimeloyl-[acyl-carrier protein] methyl ester esterase
LTSKIKVIKKGTGQALLVLHGWGMNQSVWSSVAEGLEANFTVYWVDLAGHGMNCDIALVDIETSSTLIAAEIPQQTLILAWSLGGLIAQQIANQFPEKVSRLCLVASSPCFVQKSNWSTAMPASLLDSFMENLRNDFAKTLKQFLVLQFLGVRGIQVQLKQLQAELLANPPTEQALMDGLAILQSADFRQANIHIKISTHWILGKLDRLVPIALAPILEQQANTSVTQIAKAGHAPFISHPKEFLKAVFRAFQT